MNISKKVWDKPQGRQIEEISPVIEGNFNFYKDKKAVKIFKMNRFLFLLLLITLVLSIGSYSMVIQKENILSQKHKETNKIKLENLRLQAKVDNARSFYNIKNKVKTLGSLKRPTKIMEIKSLVSSPLIALNNFEKVKIKPLSGY